MRSWSPWPQLALSVVLGGTIFGVGFRLTSEVTVVLAATMAVSGVLGLVAPGRPWLSGLGVGLGTRFAALIVPEAPLSPEHIAKYGAGQPLPLPFGLTGSPVAQWLAGSLLIMAFPFIGAYVGWMLRKIAERLAA